ncbi:MAG: NADH-quinone oxidoreductase subunit L, partial [Burkholderiaceae bacterium]
YAGSLDFSEVFSNARNLSDITISFFGFQLDLLFLMCCCLFIGAMGKSAQIPLHVWLPDSMEGPTPISALIHAATMVTAGIFMVARLSPIFELSQSALSVIFIIGGFTAFFTGILGMFQNDIKRIVAYSTLSQLGYMTVALGCSAYSLAIFHLVTHAFFKALLFLGAGSVIIGMHHEQDIRKMGGLYRYMPLTYSLMLIGSLSLMGIPFLSGFYSKDLILLAVNERVGDLSELIYWFLNIGVIVTAFYSTRLMLLVFHGRPRFNTKELVPKESPAVVWFPLLLLAIPSIFLGGLLVQPFVINNFLQQEIFVMEGNNIVLSIVENFSSAVDFAVHGFYSMPIALVGVGILLAVGVYKFYPSFSNDCNDSDNYFFRLFREKYFFDLFYLQLLVKNVIKVGERLYAISERILIDRLMVHGTVNLTKRLAGSIKISQTGFVFHYAIGMISGIAIFLWWFIPAAKMS